MTGDGVRLQSTSHPIAPWWKRLWFRFWLRFVHRIDPNSLVAVEVESDPSQPSMEETMDRVYGDYLSRQASKKETSP